MVEPRGRIFWILSPVLKKQFFSRGHSIYHESFLEDTSLTFFKIEIYFYWA
jgi:hypothetical protein